MGASISSVYTREMGESTSDGCEKNPWATEGKCFEGISAGILQML
jgi:hypothetical protein